MKRLCLFLILFILFSVPVTAAESTEDYFDILLDETDLQTKHLLESFGIKNGLYEEILNLDFSNVLEQFLALCRSELREPLKAVLLTFILVFGLSIVQTLTATASSLYDTVCVMSKVMTTLSLLIPITDCITDVLSACRATTEFTKVLIPVLAGIVTAAGKPTIALCFQGFCFSAAQALSVFFQSSLPAVCASYIALSVCGNIFPFGSTEKIAELLKKGYTMILSFVSALFSGLLSVKSVIAGCADTVAVKGVKFIVGNAVPVVGGALSDALNSVVSSILMLKSSVGILAILLLIFINLPLLTTLLMWLISLKLLNAAVDILGFDSDCRLIGAFESLLLILIAVAFFQMFLFIIAVAILVIISGMG